MKALTICQPYAHLIVRGEKRVENREWSTNYRGELAIHAGKSRQWLGDDDCEHFTVIGDPIIFGAIVGVAQLVACLHIERIRAGTYDAEYPWLQTHAHTSGTWCWVLSKVRRLAKPIPFKGAQGLWLTGEQNYFPEVIDA